MRRETWIIKGFKIALVLLIVIAGFGQSVLQLWNWLMPTVFGLHPITFWQAVGLMALSWILFGGFRGIWGVPRRRYGAARWERMTPEQREKFRSGLQSHDARCHSAVEPKS